MADSARLTHVSPGVYSREIDMTYAVKSLGITTLGLVGETQKGPAFEPIAVENWRDFQNTFGGTSTEKFNDSQYPKYELPYIAKSYLSESNQLQVCRVLGLSGYHAGPAWMVTTSGTSNSGYDNMVVAVIRSRGFYSKYLNLEGLVDSDTACECASKGYDVLTYQVGEVNNYDCTTPKAYNMSALALKPYQNLTSSRKTCESYALSSEESASGEVVSSSSTANYGKFVIEGIVGAHTVGTTPSDDKASDSVFSYPVSLNPNDKDYILKVLGSNPWDGEAPVYVEALYDVALEQGINTNDIKGIRTALSGYAAYNTSDFSVLEPVFGIIEKADSALSRRDLGKRFLADANAVEEISAQTRFIDYQKGSFVLDESGATSAETVTVGNIYTVKQYTDPQGKRHYYYTQYTNLPVLSGDSASTIALADKLSNTENKAYLVKNEADNYYYKLSGTTDVTPVTCDFHDYKSAYRFASTPWIVSNVKGDAKNIELTSLFRFHTISDGDSANKEIKISIANIKPDEGLFDVLVRDINDTDASVQVLESFSKCNMIPGDKNYVAYRIGSYDGVYETKSKYITVEVNETLVAQTSMPCGFLGYPLGNYGGTPISGAANEEINAPLIKYNLNYDEDVKNKKQYFGLSNIVGVDVDMFTYKGEAAYGDLSVVSNGFHLDSRLDANSYASSGEVPTITVDGVEGYIFDTVSTNNRTAILTDTPIIGTEAEMDNSIYSYTNLRKFTVYFYGGFDGWDIYRGQRTNTDDFKLTKYKGDFNSTNGLGYSFDRIDNYESLGLTERGLTSDFYAYLSAARKFANPEAVDINVFATPGIDLINHTLLSKEIIEMIEEERADSIYVANVPDKPMGASDYVDDMYTPEEIVDELEDTEIDSNYTCTYYPWVKYEDVDNNQYIYVSPTKDVVRNMAITDNTTYPWFAPAGISRGDVSCARAHFITKLSDEDTLYEGRINPVKTFASDGVKLWGQKNLQITESQLNRIAVRRLLLRMRKLIAIACVGLIFEPNDSTTKNKFLSTVTPIMDNIRANRGISDYKIEVNDTVETRERRELPAKIYFKPYNALEYITLDFIVTPESVDFNAI